MTSITSCRRLWGRKACDTRISTVLFSRWPPGAGLKSVVSTPFRIISAGAVVGPQRAVELFESAYDEHAHRLSKLYENVGNGGGAG